MMYEVNGEYYNLDRILKVARLNNYFRRYYKKQAAQPEKRGWFKIIPAVPEKYVCEDWRGTITEVTRKQAVYDGRFIRIWIDPKYVDSWGYGINLEFATVELAEKFLEAVLRNKECKFND